MRKTNKQPREKKINFENFKNFEQKVVCKTPPRVTARDYSNEKNYGNLINL